MRLTILLLLFAQIAHAQWTQTGGYASAKANTTVAATGDLIFNGGTFRNLGKVSCQNLRTEPAATLRGTGNWTIQQNLSTLGPVLDNSTFTLAGDAAATVATGSSPLYRLWLDKSDEQIVGLASPLSIANQLKFVGTANKLALHEHDLKIMTSASITGAGATHFIVTDGNGHLVRQNLDTAYFKFPIGSSPTEYNLLQINNIGTSDDIGVRCQPNVLQGGDSGLPFSSDAVAASWEVTEAAPGGSNLGLKASWYLPDELPGFARHHCALRRHNGLVWESGPIGSATGANPYIRTRTGLTEVGYFAVLDNSIPFAASDDRAAVGSIRMDILPNPASEFVQVQISGEGFTQILEIQVFNAQGRRVKDLTTFEKLSNLTFNVADLPPGEYFVQVRGEGARAWGRLVKM